MYAVWILMKKKIFQPSNSYICFMQLHLKECESRNSNWILVFSSTSTKELKALGFFLPLVFFYETGYDRVYKLYINYMYLQMPLYTYTLIIKQIQKNFRNGKVVFLCTNYFVIEQISVWHPQSSTTKWKDISCINQFNAFEDICGHFVWFKHAFKCSSFLIHH